jgi:hypothetical protein
MEDEEFDLGGEFRGGGVEEDSLSKVGMTC